MAGPPPPPPGYGVPSGRSADRGSSTWALAAAVVLLLIGLVMTPYVGAPHFQRRSA